jgi:hypothetical protein
MHRLLTQHVSFFPPCCPLLIIVDSCTPAFLDFLDWLGEPVRLNGWKGYKAGLDTIGKENVHY